MTLYRITPNGKDAYTVLAAIERGHLVPVKPCRHGNYDEHEVGRYLGPKGDWHPGWICSGKPEVEREARSGGNDMTTGYKVGDTIDVQYENHHQQGVIVEVGKVWMNNSRYQTAWLRSDIDVWVNLTKAQSIRIVVTT